MARQKNRKIFNFQKIYWNKIVRFFILMNRANKYIYFYDPKYSIIHWLPEKIGKYLIFSKYLWFFPQSTPSPRTIEYFCIIYTQVKNKKMYLFEVENKFGGVLQVLLPLVGKPGHRSTIQQSEQQFSEIIASLYAIKIMTLWM